MGASIVVARLQASLADRYRLERELGRGGMAVVYLAHDLKHDRQLALKVLLPEIASPLAPARFQREVRFAARLQHPHILPLHDSGASAGYLWFTMPYVEGESLRERLRRERQLPVDEALRIAHEVARALDYAHREGLVHRDIKPENILLSRDGDALVADFGIGKALGDAAEGQRAPAPNPGDHAEENLTGIGSVVGTPRYMSLEQADGAPLDGRADTYSLGVVLYEMLAGEPPFAGRTAHAIVAQQLTETPPPLRAARETVPPELESVVMRMLARDRADRYPTAGELADALDELRRGGAAPPSTPRRFRARWVAGAIAAAGLAGLAGGVLRWRSVPEPELRPSVVAVAPFDVLDPRLALWREGLVDLLSRNLDGAGPLRTVPPTVVIRRWSGRADPPSAAELGRRTGAGLAIYGSLLASGPDSVRLRATLLDVASGRALDEWEAVGQMDRMDQLTDSLTLRLLKELGRSRPIGSVRLTGFGGTSLPVLKAFLQGEQFFRQSEWDSALTYYQRAVELDTSFAPALRKVFAARGWRAIPPAFDSATAVYALRAGAHNHGLPPRDSLLIAADSLFASMHQAGPLAIFADTGWMDRRRRLLAVLADATTRYPDDPEAWFLLGDARVHFGAFGLTSYAEQLQAFDRAIALDSAFAPSYIHTIPLASRYGADAMRRYLRPYLALAPGDESRAGARLALQLLDGGSRGADATARLDREPDGDLLSAADALEAFPDSTESAVGLIRTVSSRGRSMPMPNGTDFLKFTMVRTLMARGHLRDAQQFLSGQEQYLGYGEAAFLGAVPAERAAVVFRGRLSGPASHLLAAAFPWWASHGDTASLHRAEARADSLARGEPEPADHARGQYVAASAAAYLALARADTATALERFLALPEGGCLACYLDRFTLATLLVERHRDREAWGILQGEPATSTLAPFATEVLWTLLRGRVAERLGDRERAIQSYSWVAGMWRNADRELQPYVLEAGEGLTRLTREAR